MDPIMRFHYGTASREISAIYLSKLQNNLTRFQFASVNSLRAKSPGTMNFTRVILTFLSRMISLKYYIYFALSEFIPLFGACTIFLFLSAKPPHFNIALDYRTIIYLINGYPPNFPSLSDPSFTLSYSLYLFYYSIIDVAHLSLLDVLVIGSVAYRVERNPLNVHLCTNHNYHHPNAPPWLLH